MLNQNGFTDFIEKPFNIESLHKLLKQYIKIDPL
jgi:FixJ family two-component response regulator